MADIIVDGTIGAKRFLLLDSTGKIPAVDGSQVTALAAGNIATDIIPIARIDVGTTANKLVQLDANAKLPALDASLLTNIPGATKSANDPAIDTNPSGGVGSEWHNTTSGEAYICTDATTDENVWTNVGAGTGDVQPWSFQGTQYGYCAGGYNLQSGAHRDEIQKYSFASDGNAIDVGNTLLEQHYRCGATGTTHGYTMGGTTGPTNTHGRVEKWPYASDTNSTLVGNLYLITSGTSSACTAGYIFCASGSGATGSYDVICRTATASDADAIDWADTVNMGTHNTAGNSSTTHGYRSQGEGGVSPHPQSDDIEKYPFASQTNATDVGSLTIARYSAAAASSTDYGYIVGDTPNTGENMERIDRFAFASDGNATDHADNNYRAGTMHGNSSTTHAYFAGGSESGPYTNNISKIAYASTGTATDVGDLVIGVGYTGATGANY